MHRNYWEHDECDGPPIPRDEHGRTITPTIEDLQRQLQKVRKAKEQERIAQEKQRRWDQR